MKDERKTKKQLIAELGSMRQQRSVDRAADDIRKAVLAMRRAEDLCQVIVAIRRGMEKLGFDIYGCSIGFLDDDKELTRLYIAEENPRKLGISWTSSDLIEVDEDTVVTVMEASISPSIIERIRRDEVSMNEIAYNSRNFARQYGLEHPMPLLADGTKLFNIVVPFTYPNGTGGIGMGSLGPLTEGQIAIVRRFSAILSQGYLRFLDFQQLEEQNQRLTEERGLESVRAEVSSMQESEDLFKVIGNVEKNIKALGIPADRFSLNIIDEEANLMRVYWENGFLGELTNIQEADNDTGRDYQHWKEGEIYQRSVKRDFGEGWIVDAPFSHGMLAMGFKQSEPYSESEIAILQRFAEIVSLGYSRFLDFQKVDEAQKKLIDELEEELQTAHDLQMGLMPAESPQIQGFDIAGRCIPFNHVGGDFFQYFERDGKLSICMADVTGHAMEAAVPVMMVSGVLKTEMRFNAPLEQLFGHLNRTMHESLDSRTYVCFTMGELDLATRTFHLSNAACPYPFHFHATTGELEELQVEAYPLGIRTEADYTAIETTLKPGDTVVFCSDGIIEMGSEREEIFGFERTAQTIHQGCRENLSAHGLIDRIIESVQDFAGDVPQGDDMTCVVIKVES